MALLGKDTKQPREVLAYGVDFGDWMPTDDAIDTVTAKVYLRSGPEDTPLTVDKIEHTATYVKPWLSGGADGAKYRVEVRIKTLAEQTKEAEFDITVKEV